jgi:hypothetical protein
MKATGIGLALHTYIGRDRNLKRPTWHHHRGGSPLACELRRGDASVAAREPAQVDARGAGSLRRVARAIAAAPAIEAERGGVDALRAGAQYALPLERVSLIARAGVARLTDAGVRTASAAGAPLAGSAPARTRLTAGAGVAFEKTALDLAYDGAGRWSVERSACGGCDPPTATSGTQSSTRAEFCRVVIDPVIPRQ